MNLRAGIEDPSTIFTLNRPLRLQRLLTTSNGFRRLKVMRTCRWRTVPGCGLGSVDGTRRVVCQPRRRWLSEAVGTSCLRIVHNYLPLGGDG